MPSAEQELPNDAMKFPQGIQTNKLFQQQNDIHYASIICTMAYTLKIFIRHVSK